MNQLGSLQHTCAFVFVAAFQLVLQLAFVSAGIYFAKHTHTHTYLDFVVLSYLIDGIPQAKAKISLKSRKGATTAHFIW